MNINYKYEVVAVDEAANCMEVRYESTGHAPQNIGCRLPFVGETLEGVIDMYAPISFWGEQQRTTVPVAVGTRGSNTAVMAPLTAEAQAQQAANAAMWAQIDFEKKVAAVLVKFNVLAVDPTTIGVSKL